MFPVATRENRFRTGVTPSAGMKYLGGIEFKKKWECGSSP
jgi:hypothetical protein